MTDWLESDSLHPGHHSIRLKGYDYSQPGLYFVTICTHEKKCILGTVRSARVSLTPLGMIAHECWMAIPSHFPWITLLDFVVMPNHIHGILEFDRQLGRSNAAPLHREESSLGVVPGSLGVVIRSFKAAVTKRSRLALGPSFEVLWQRNYFEKVLRPGKELGNARAYIQENPQKWQWDSENPGAIRR